MAQNDNLQTPEGMRELTKEEMAQTVGGVEVSPFNDKLIGIAQDLAIEFTVGGDRFDRDDIALALYEAGLKTEQLLEFRDYIRKLPQCEFPYEAEIEMRLNAGEERMLHGLSDSFDPAIESLEDQREAHIDFIEKELNTWLPDDVLEIGKSAYVKQEHERIKHERYGRRYTDFNDKLIGIAMDLALEITVGGGRFGKEEFALALYEAGLEAEHLSDYRHYVCLLYQCEYPEELLYEDWSTDLAIALHYEPDLEFTPEYQKELEAFENLEGEKLEHEKFIREQVGKWLPDNVLEMGRLASLERLAVSDCAQQEGSVREEVRLSISSPSGGTLLDEVARIFPDETGREPVRVEKLRNGNSVSVYDGFEYDIVGNAIEISSNRVHAVETAPDGQLLGSYFLIGNSYGDLKDGPELSRTGYGWAYRINSAIRTSDEYLSSNSIIFDRDGNLDWEKTEKEKNFNDFYISPEAELAKFNHPRMDTVPFQESVRLLFEKDSSGAMIVNMKDGKALTIDGASAGSEGLYVIKKDGKFNYISEDGNLLLKNWVDSATEYKDGKAKCKLGNATLEIDRTGTLLKKQEISAGQVKGPRNN